MMTIESTRRTFVKTAAAGIVGTAAVASGSAAASPISVGYPVFTTTNLNVRDDPSLSGGVVNTAHENTGMVIDDGPWENDGYTWWRVKVNGDSDHLQRYEGYAVEEFMEVANFSYTSDNVITSVYGDGRDHSGVDLAHTNGQPRPIYAGRHGTVSHTGWISGYGNTVIVDHGGGLETLYAHLSEYDTSEGDQVERGHRIGTTGETGNSTGIHLHYEVRVDGTPQWWPMVKNSYVWVGSGVPRRWID